MVYAIGGTTLTMTFGSVVLPGNRGDLALSLLLNQMETRNALSHVLREAVAEFEIPVLVLMVVYV